MILVMFNVFGPRPIGTAVIAIAVAAILLGAACSDETPTTSSDGEEAADQSPTAEVFAPTPSPTPTTIPSPTSTPTPTPTSFSVALPLPPTATPRPTSTPEPTPTPLELADVEAQLEAQLPTARLHGQALLLEDGRVLIAGGNLPTVANQGLIISDAHPFLEVYDPEPTTWHLVRPLDVGLQDVRVSLLPDGNVLVFALRKPHGEESPFWPLRLADTEDDTPLPHHRVFVLDVDSLTMSEVSEATVPRLSPTFIQLADGRILVAGGVAMQLEEGRFGLPPSTAVEIYDPVSNTWKMAAPLGGGLVDEVLGPDGDPSFQWFQSHRDGAIMAIGGRIDSSDNRGEIVFYDPAEDSWESVNEFSLDYSDRPWGAVQAPSGQFYLLFEDRIEIYDPTLNEWSFTYGPRGVPVDASTDFLPDGRLFLAGGATTHDSSLPRGTTEIYDPATGLWGSGPDLGKTRSSHSATVLANGNVLLHSGITIWEENESEGVFTDSFEIMPADRLAAVDTVTPRQGELADRNPWEACVQVFGLESLSPLSTGDVSPPESARDVLTAADETMLGLSSYAEVSASMRFNRSELDIRARMTNRNCNYNSLRYSHSTGYESEWLYISERRISSHVERVGIGPITYARKLVGFGGNRNDEWTVTVSDNSDEIDESFDYWFSDEALDNMIDLEIDGIEQLNGIDVYRIHGKITYEGVHYGSTVTYWIGVDDNRVRRLLHKWDTAWDWVEGDDPIQYEFDLTEFTSFDEDFEIRHPLTPEERAHPRAFGWPKCEDASRLSRGPFGEGEGSVDADEAQSIVMRSVQAMGALSTYAATDVLYRFGPWNQSCDLNLDQYTQQSGRTSRRTTFFDEELSTDISHIFLAASEYIREMDADEWTQQQYDDTESISWPHTDILDLAISDGVSNLKVVAKESIGGTEVYRINGEITREEDGNEDRLSLWIGVEDHLLRRAIVTRERDDLGSHRDTDYRLVEFHSFNEDFNIQPPPEDEIAE